MPYLSFSQPLKLKLGDLCVRTYIWYQKCVSSPEEENIMGPYVSQSSRLTGWNFPNLKNIPEYFSSTPLSIFLLPLSDMYDSTYFFLWKIRINGTGLLILCTKLMNSQDIGDILAGGINILMRYPIFYFITDIIRAFMTRKDLDQGKTPTAQEDMVGLTKIFPWGNLLNIVPILSLLSSLTLLSLSLFTLLPPPYPVSSSYF